ncbi:MAG: glutaredoxin family protein [Thiogranum sp.]
MRLVDVDRDPQLARRYDEWVPVLCHGEQEICHYRLDERALRTALHCQ